MLKHDSYLYLNIITIMREDKKIKKEQQPSSYSNIFLLPIIFGIIVIIAMKHNPFKMEEVSTLKKKMRRQHVSF